ncbi:hypothetical protein CEE45_16230 [Candidatus Heimdallarchaeota archaeon B3_Heim]|nr:MAG: hypothetical protein CEE45_16230 [Candidatus Heimdallarchaeota archaeon B3_Heim]
MKWGLKMILQTLSASHHGETQLQNIVNTSDLISWIILALFLTTIGILIARKKVEANIRLLLCILGFILVFDELWMLGIPLGHILPDMSDFHVEGVHHWMFGLSFLFVCTINVLFSPKIEGDKNKTMLNDQLRLVQGGSLFLIIIILLKDLNS